MFTPANFQYKGETKWPKIRYANCPRIGDCGVCSGYILLVVLGSCAEAASTGAFNEEDGCHFTLAAWRPRAPRRFGERRRPLGIPDRPRRQPIRESPQTDSQGGL
jgi:hypothetical protein